ncbi:TetR/AcrR family transcriptional regulator [Streptomyces sp. NBC_01216]|uniref:TetR/AcrR family transcriptional regulator n=1 Tax=unclassified Streptomyces TaxID=2593676 RepID=UPI002E0EC179|nr:TetR/AcrR family transcriptional regulator [Streptomyces sp. NBC_01216]
MPAAREALLDAALAAVARLPWSAVRMVDVAADARVSRQTLYNEFGSKDGLARALLRREADAYLAGVARRLAGPAAMPDRLAGTAEWIVAEARDRPLLRALLTGCWGGRLPAPRPARTGTQGSGVPAQRRADAGPPTPGELIAATLVCVDVRWAGTCELTVRLALSHLLAADPRGVGGLVRGALGGRLSAPNPTAGGR